MASFASLMAQVVTTDPIFPIDDQQVTVTFDAAEGNKELKDCNCVVYAHTGLITDKSTSGSDWKYVQGVWGTDDTPRKMRSQCLFLYWFITRLLIKFSKSIKQTEFYSCFVELTYKYRSIYSVTVLGFETI